MLLRGDMTNLEHGQPCQHKGIDTLPLVTPLQSEYTSSEALGQSYMM